MPLLSAVGGGGGGGPSDPTTAASSCGAAATSRRALDGDGGRGGGAKRRAMSLRSSGSSLCDRERITAWSPDSAGGGGGGGGGGGLATRERSSATRSSSCLATINGMTSGRASTSSSSRRSNDSTLVKPAAESASCCAPVNCRSLSRARKEPGAAVPPAALLALSGANRSCSDHVSERKSSRLFRSRVTHHQIDASRRWCARMLFAKRFALEFGRRRGAHRRTKRKVSKYVQFRVRLLMWVIAVVLGRLVSKVYMSGATLTGGEFQAERVPIKRLEPDAALCAQLAFCCRICTIRTSL